jgi:hypothetical protein
LALQAMAGSHYLVMPQSWSICHELAQKKCLRWSRECAAKLYGDLLPLHWLCASCWSQPTNLLFVATEEHACRDPDVVFCFV